MAITRVSAGQREQVFKEIGGVMRLSDTNRLVFAVYDESNAGRYLNLRGNSLILPGQAQASIRKGIGSVYQRSYADSSFWSYTDEDIPIMWGDKLARFAVENGGHVIAGVDKVTGLVVGASFSVPFGVVINSHTDNLGPVIAEVSRFIENKGINAPQTDYTVDRIVHPQLQNRGIGTLTVEIRDAISMEHGLGGHVTWTSHLAERAHAALQRRGYEIAGKGLGAEFMGTEEERQFGVERPNERPWFFRKFNESDRVFPLVDVIRP